MNPELKSPCQFVRALAIGSVLVAAIASSFGTPPANYVLNWSDEFNQGVGLAPNSATWAYDLGGGGWGNNELETYVSDLQHCSIVSDANATDGMALQILATNDANGYESARIKTSGKVDFQYGFIEGRIRIPYGQGIWPAFWMLGQDITSGSRWPACGEVDIMENIGKQSWWGTVQGTSHSTNHSGGNGFWAQYNLPSGQYFKDAYHLFQIEWAQNKIAWYVDGNLYHVVTTVDTGSDPWPFNAPFFVVLNTAIGGNWPGNPDSTTVWPQHMLIDYVRYYKYQPTAVPATPSGLSATVADQAHINLTWTADPAFAVTYNVYRSTTANFMPSSSNLIASGVPLASYGDSGLSANTTYYYAVATVNTLGASAPSALVSAITAVAGSGVNVNSAGGGIANWIADSYVSGGNTASTTATIDTSLLGTNVPPQYVLQTLRWGAFTYAIPNLTKGRTYTVGLDFVDNYWTSAGQREFNVSINGTQVLTNFDIIGAAGAQNKAIRETFTTTANQRGQIQIKFTTGAVDNPTVSGIEIKP